MLWAGTRREKRSNTRNELAQEERRGGTRGMGWDMKREEEEHEECYELAHEEGGGGRGKTWMWIIER